MPFPNEIPTLIQGEVTAWSSIRIQLNNMTLPLLSVTAINYGATREKTNVYAIGDQPIGRSYGAVTYEAAMTVLKDDLRPLIDAAPFGDISLLQPFEIIISFRSTIAGKVTTEILKNCEFTNNPFSASQGDTSLPVELTLIYAGNKFGDNPFI